MFRSTDIICKMGGGTTSQWLTSMGKFLTIIIVMFWLEFSLHEFLHFITTHLLGGTAVFHFNIQGIFMGRLEFITMPSDPRIVAFAGGLGTATIFSLLYLLGEKYWDWRFKFCFFLIISVEYFYGLIEGFTF